MNINIEDSPKGLTETCLQAPELHLKNGRFCNKKACLYQRRFLNEQARHKGTFRNRQKLS